jgi:hypothetical protein
MRLHWPCRIHNCHRRLHSRINDGNRISTRTAAALPVAAALLLTSTACFTSHVRTSYTDAGNFHESRPFEAAPPFDYQKSEVSFTYPPRKISSSIQRLSNGAVHALHVQGDNYLADWSGVVAAADESEFLELWRQSVERQRVTVIDVRRLVDWAEGRPEIDPDQVDPRRILIIDAGRDTCVPESSRNDLWLALGKPERISMNYDHEPAFYSITPLGFNWMRRQIWGFLEARLLNESPAQPTERYTPHNTRPLALRVQP